MAREEAEDLLPLAEEVPSGSEAEAILGKTAADRAWSARRGGLAATLVGAALLLAAAAASARRGGATGPSPSSAALASQAFLAEAHTSSPSSAAGADCSEIGDNCNATKCCRDPSKHCFAKADYWATCLGTCIAGIHEEDGTDHPEPWSCNLLGRKTVPLTTLHWNVHWQCSRARDGSSGDCRAKAASRLVELAKTSGTNIVAAIELADDAGTPVSLPNAGLKGWAQVDGKCSNVNPDLWDSVLMVLAPGWRVRDSGGGCLNGRADTRAFAAARVRPPWDVHGCPELCVVALHAPHMQITEGHPTVARVCGAAVDHCAVALGDWNVPIAGGANGGVANRWAELVGGSPPGLVLPNWRTCCYPEWKYHGFYDHVATNIPAAHTEGKNGSTGFLVYPYQILEADPVESHKPLSVWLRLPSA